MWGLLKWLWFAVSGKRILWIAAMRDAVGARNAGDFAASAQHFKLAYDIMRGCFGVNDLRTATAANSLSHAYEKIGKYDDAERLHKDALAAAEKCCPADSPKLI